MAKLQSVFSIPPRHFRAFNNVRNEYVYNVKTITANDTVSDVIFKTVIHQNNRVWPRKSEASLFERES